MKTLIATAAAIVTTGLTQAQLIIADDNTVTGVGSGFVLDTGINTGINPDGDPAVTRLTGSAAPGLRYVQTAIGKDPVNYTISGNGRQRIGQSANSGRYTLSANGTSGFDFGSFLGTAGASAANPITYDVTLSMSSSVAGTTRFSFALATAEDNANLWDFGLQLYRAVGTQDFYTIQKRIDRVSYTTSSDSSTATGDINAAITTTAAGTYGDQLNFLMRVTDAGAETTTFSSRIQLSMDNGSTWFYDTSNDAAIGSQFRFDTTARYFSWDQAGGSGTGAWTYDNFSVTLVPEPSVFAVSLIGGAMALIRRRRS